MVRDQTKTLEEFFKDMNIKETQYLDWARYAVSLNSINLNRLPNMNTCIKDGFGKPYIPGSSLKGVLRSVFLFAKIKIDFKTNTDDAQRLIDASYDLERKEGKDLRDQLKKFSSKATEIYKDKFNFSGLSVGDSKSLTLEDLTVVQKIDGENDRKRFTHINLMRETIKPNVQIEFPLSIDTEKLGFNEDFSLVHLNRLIELYHQYYMEAFGSKFDTDLVPKGVSSSGSSFYLGGGSGFVSKTLLHLCLQEVNGENIDYSFGHKITASYLDAAFRNKDRYMHRNHFNAKGFSPKKVKLARDGQGFVEMGRVKLNLKKSVELNPKKSVELK